MPFHSFLDFSPHCYFYSSCHGEFVFILEQWHRFTINAVDFVFLFFLIGFLIAHECDHSFGALLTYGLLF